MSKSRTCLKITRFFWAQGEKRSHNKKNTILDNARRFTTPWRNVRTFSHCCTSGATLFWHAFLVGLMWLFGRVATRTFAFPYTTSHRKRGPRFSAKSTTVGICSHLSSFGDGEGCVESMSPTNTLVPHRGSWFAAKPGRPNIVAAAQVDRRKSRRQPHRQLRRSETRKSVESNCANALDGTQEYGTPDNGPQSERNNAQQWSGRGSHDVFVCRICCCVSPSMVMPICWPSGSKTTGHRHSVNRFPCRVELWMIFLVKSDPAQLDLSFGSYGNCSPSWFRTFFGEKNCNVSKIRGFSGRLNHVRFVVCRLNSVERRILISAKVEVKMLRHPCSLASKRHSCEPGHSSREEKLCS